MVSLRLASASLLFLALFTPSTAQAKAPGSCSTTYTRQMAHGAMRSYFHRPTPAKRKTVRRIVVCQRGGRRSRRIMRRHYTRYKRAWQRRQAVNAVTPFRGPNGSRWAIPWPIVACESGGNFRAYNGILGAGGAYQIIPSTWAGYGGRRYASVANVAPPYAQHIIASRIWSGGSGRGQWAC